MAFASPSASSHKIFSLADTSTAAATTTYNFTIPQDSDGIIAKIWLASTWSASGTAAITIQTTEDGGSTWRDVSSTTVGASTVAAQVGNQNAHFIPINCISSVGGPKIANYVGSVAASTLVLTGTNASVTGTVSGLPMMGTLGRVQITYTGTISTGGVNVDIFAPTVELR